MKTTQKFYFDKSRYLRVLQSLHASIQEHGFAFLTGKPAVGKSEALTRFALYLERQGIKPVTCSGSDLDLDQLHALLMRHFDIPDSQNIAMLVSELARTTNSENLQQSRAKLVLMIDDAHLLSEVLLVELANLVMAQKGSETLFCVILCAAEMPGSRAVDKIDAQVITLSAMTEDEVKEFVKDYGNALFNAQLEFDSSAASFLLKRSRGLPGAVQELAKKLCQRIYLEQPERYAGKKLDRLMLEEIFMDKAPGHLTSAVHSVEQLRWPLILPVVVVLAVASMAFLYTELDTGFNAGTESDPQLASANAFVVSEETAVFEEATVIEETAVNEEASNSPFADAQLGATVATASPSRLDASIASEESVLPEEAVGTGEEVTDSGLLLVTAAERGISADAFALPDFEELQESEESITAAALDEQITETSSTVESQSSDADPVVESAAVVIADSGREQSEQSQSDATLLVSASQESAVENESASRWEAIIISWVSAWQSQNLQAYFAAYHEDFQPRYHQSKSAWEANRNRVIGGAATIELRMYDFELVLEDSTEVEVHFWLDYESANYQDQTRKKIVLAPVDDKWLILEEINLEVRV